MFFSFSNRSDSQCHRNTRIYCTVMIFRLIVSLLQNCSLYHPDVLVHCISVILLSIEAIVFLTK